MGTDNNARGTYMFPDLPYIGAGTGVKTDYGVLLPPTSRVACYVRSTGPQGYDSPPLRENIVLTLAAALKQVRSGLGDTIVVLPGHSESVTDATMLDNLLPGTKIIGIGRGSNMPVFRWTATASQWTLGQADCVFSGLRLRLEGANGVVKAILCTAADNLIAGCDIEVASGATAKATIAIEAGAGATRFNLVGNVLRGTATHNVTDGVKVVAAVDGLRIAGNEMIFSATAANGNVHITAAATNCMIRNNLLYNTHTSSTACIAVDNVAADGVLADNRMATAVGTGTAPASAGIILGAAALFRCFENYSTPTAATSGIICPVVDV